MNTADITNTADLIKQARTGAELTQQQLANHYKIPLRTLVEWERGTRTPPEYVLDFLLRCIKEDFDQVEQPAEVLSEVEAPKTKVFTDERSRPLIEPILSIVKEAFENNKVQIIDTQSFEGYTIVDPRKGKPFILSEYDGDEIPIGVTFYVKEV